jgi:uncharacterized protein YfcZ (UPF0381/DUF406 family)
MTVHAAPTITPCCRVDIGQLPDDDRIAAEWSHVTCRMGEADGVAQHLAAQIAARHPARPSSWIGCLVGLTPEHVDLVVRKGAR